MRLTPGDSNAARVLAARVVAHLTPGATLAMAFAQGSDGLTAQLQGQSRPAFLIATNPLEDTGFVRTGQSALAVRHQLGAWGLTVSAENGRTQLSTPWHQGAIPAALQKRDNATRLAMAVDRRFGTVETSFGASWMSEDHTLLGARLADTFGARGRFAVPRQLAGLATRGRLVSGRGMAAGLHPCPRRHADRFGIAADLLWLGGGRRDDQCADVGRQPVPARQPAPARGAGRREPVSAGQL
jgi:hypothetical protein